MWMPAKIAPLRSRLTDAWQRRAISLKAASFALIGVINTLVDFGVFLLARELFRLPYSMFALAGIADFCHCGSAEKLALIPANVVAWAVAVSGSYVLNSLVTFSVESGRRLRLKSFASFVASGIAGLIANTATVYGLSYFIPEVLAKLCAILASFVVNFSLSHFVVFRAPKVAPPKGANEDHAAGKR
jgi:putative flippase GtrA